MILVSKVPKFYSRHKRYSLRVHFNATQHSTIPQFFRILQENHNETEKPSHSTIKHSVRMCEIKRSRHKGRRLRSCETALLRGL